MYILIIGLLIFLAMHSIRIFADDWRTAQRERLGEMRWKGLYALVSLVGFVMIVWGFAMARAVPVVLWTPPLWTRHIAVALMLLSFILLAASKVKGNHIKARIGHPMLAGVKTWAFAHLLANGTLVDVVLFGSFLVWSIAAFANSRRRDRAAGVTYPAAGYGRDAVMVGSGVLAWVLFVFYGHEWLIGVRPLG